MLNQQQILIAFQADDKPGIVNQLSELIKKHEGNWHESRLCQLGGLFSGLITAGISEENVISFQEELTATPNIEITRFQIANQNIKPATYYKLDLIGADRSGIIKEISHALTEHKLNIQTMETQISSAAMSGEALFSALITFSSPLHEISSVEQAIDDIANELTLDICLTELNDN